MLSDTDFKGEGPAPSGSRPPLVTAGDEEAKLGFQVDVEVRSEVEVEEGEEV